MDTPKLLGDAELERAVQTLEQLRSSVEKTYREMQETGDEGPMRLARMRFQVRVKAIQASRPDAFQQWMQGNARFLRAVEQGRNPILC